MAGQILQYHILMILSSHAIRSVISMFVPCLNFVFMFFSARLPTRTNRSHEGVLIHDGRRGSRASLGGFNLAGGDGRDARDSARLDTSDSGGGRAAGGDGVGLKSSGERKRSSG